MSRLIAWLYSGVVALASAWAWFVDVSLWNDPREHLLPDLVLSFVAMPLSLSLGAIYPAAQSLFDAPFVQLIFLSVCGALQAALLWWVSVKLKRHRAAPN